MNAPDKPTFVPGLGSPPILLATWFGVGRIRPAPGTWGSLAALPFAWLIASMGGPIALAAGVISVSLVGIWAAQRYTEACGAEDASEIVIDEVAGIWLTLLLTPPDILLYGLGFVYFRLFDIWKPWPVRWADRNIHGGLGVMLDDLLAGIYAFIALSVTIYLLP